MAAEAEAADPPTLSRAADSNVDEFRADLEDSLAGKESPPRRRRESCKLGRGSAAAVGPGSSSGERVV